ncbi:hypothetical protein ACOMHN_019356 [Nucella lapillus]
MTSVFDRLRQTPKGQLEYHREIEGKALTDLLRKCSPVPALPYPHNEVIPLDPAVSASFGLGHGEDSEEGDRTQASLRLDHQYTQEGGDGCGEKGEQDSLEKETFPQGVSVDQSLSSPGSGQWCKGSHSHSSPKKDSSSVRAVSPQSAETVSHKGPWRPSPGASQATSPKSPQSPKSLYTVSPKQPVSPKSPKVVSPKSPQSPKRPQVISPKSQPVVSPKSPPVVCPKLAKSPPVASPKSPPGVSPGKTYIVKEGCPADVGVSPSTQGFRENFTASKSPTDTRHLKSILSTSRDSESGLMEGGDEEEAERSINNELTVSFTERLRVVAGLERNYDNESREMLEKKHQEFLVHQTHLNCHQRELVSAVQQRHLQEVSQLHEVIEKQQQSKYYGQRCTRLCRRWRVTIIIITIIMVITIIIIITFTCVFRRSEMHQAVQKMKESRHIIIITIITIITIIIITFTCVFRRSEMHQAVQKMKKSRHIIIMTIITIIIITFTCVFRRSEMHQAVQKMKESRHIIIITIITIIITFTCVFRRSEMHQAVQKMESRHIIIITIITIIIITFTCVFRRRSEMHQAVQKVKDSHQQCSRRQDARVQKLEQLSQHLHEEMAKREQALDQKLQEVQAVAHSVTAIQRGVLTALEQCPHRQHLSEVAQKTKLLVRKLSEQAEALAGGLTRRGPVEEVLTRLKQLHEQSQNALDYVHNLTAEAERKAKAAAEAEKQRQQAALAQPPQAAQTTPTAQGGQVVASPQASAAAAGEEGALLAAVAKEYEHNKKLLSHVDAAIDPFINDQQQKKVRFDLQRAVNMPVNAISPVSSQHLRDKLLRLRSLLRGERVEVVGKQVSVSAVPQGLTFCKNLVAKMIARKADEQVSSNHESAFAIASVAVGLWTEFPDVGELILAHLQALCPYVLPLYPPRLPNQSTEEYHKSLGYKTVDGNIEQQDKFLKRMSGVLRLYAAIMVTPPPQGGGAEHPHGLDHVWSWLARSMNLQPNPDITATAIYDMLSVTGGFLLQAYRVQFVKLLYFLFKAFLPKLKAVAAGSGPVIRLETFLETTMKNNALIPLPEGYLSPQFWRS